MLESFTRSAAELRITAIATGDLNGDSHIDLRPSMGRGVSWRFLPEPSGFEPALGFPVFEESLLWGGRGVEPRAILVEDFDGDGFDDVALLIHDRWILYPQDSVGSGDSR